MPDAKFEVWSKVHDSNFIVILSPVMHQTAHARRYVNRIIVHLHTDRVLECISVNNHYIQWHSTQDSVVSTWKHSHYTQLKTVGVNSFDVLMLGCSTPKTHTDTHVHTLASTAAYLTSLSQKCISFINKQQYPGWTEVGRSKGKRGGREEANKLDIKLSIWVTKNTNTRNYDHFSLPLCFMHAQRH